MYHESKQRYGSGGGTDDVEELVHFLDEITGEEEIGEETTTSEKVSDILYEETDERIIANLKRKIIMRKALMVFAGSAVLSIAFIAFGAPFRFGPTVFNVILFWIIGLAMLFFLPAVVTGWRLSGYLTTPKITRKGVYFSEPVYRDQRFTAFEDIREIRYTPGWGFNFVTDRYRNLYLGSFIKAYPVIDFNTCSDIHAVYGILKKIAGGKVKLVDK